MSTSIGLLHPGEMGAGIGSVLVAAGHPVYWVSADRSPATRRRAEQAGLTDSGSLAALVETCGLIISVCPPGSALDVARGVSGFRGLYLDANAISPPTAREVAELVESGGGRYVDGGIIGAPPSGSNVTQLYLSGPGAEEVRELFSGTEVDPRVISKDRTAASALKMCFAAWTKGTTALLLDVRALALAEGVEEPLLEAWRRSAPELASRSLVAAQQATRKGWRWIAEMEEIAATFRSVGLPDGFHVAAAHVYAGAPRDEHAPADPATFAIFLDALLARRHDGGGRTPGGEVSG